MFLLIFLSSLFCQNAKFSLGSVVVFLFCFVFTFKTHLGRGWLEGGEKGRHFQAGALFFKNPNETI